MLCRGAAGALVLGSPTRALNELVSEERERVIELLAALTASSDLVEQQRCQISDLKHALQARVTATPQGPAALCCCCNELWFADGCRTAMKMSGGLLMVALL